MATLFAKRSFWMGLVVVAVVAGILSMPAGREVVQKALGSLRMQKVQAVNVNLSPFVDPNANPALHQMVSQMISDKVEVTVNESDQPAADASAATKLAGFPVRLLQVRKDAPKLVVGGEHALKMNVDRTRLQEIVKAAGHPEIVLPDALDNASVSVQIPHIVHLQYGNCPARTTAAGAIAGQVIEKTPSATQYADCVRLSEGPTPIVNVPAGLDITKLAEIGLQVAGMTPSEAHEFFQTVDWKSTLTLSVPRQLRSYEQVKVGGVRGTLLTLSGRRGPGYTLIWADKGIAYSLTGYGDSSHAIEIADSLK
jgi:hypothetical protein